MADPTPQTHGGDCVDPGTTTSPTAIAPAGTPIEAVEMSSVAAVTAATGAFSGALPTPGQAGEYIVVAEACYGPSNCGRLAGAPISVSQPGPSRPGDPPGAPRRGG